MACLPGRFFAAFVLIWLLALVVWPERNVLAGAVYMDRVGVIAHISRGSVYRDGGWEGGYRCWGPDDFIVNHLPEDRRYTWSMDPSVPFPGPAPRYQIFERDASLGVLWDLLAPDPAATPLRVTFSQTNLLR